MVVKQHTETVTLQVFPPCQDKEFETYEPTINDNFV